MKILELFSGYGTASFALKHLGIDYELVGYSDIDKYANFCFKLNHCPNDIDDSLRLGDLSNSQRYKLAGNGQSVNVVEKIMACMFREEKEK